MTNSPLFKQAKRIHIQQADLKIISRIYTLGWREEWEKEKNEATITETQTTREQDGLNKHIPFNNNYKY